MTEDFLPKEKNKQITELAADYLAAGLNPTRGERVESKKSTLFLQSAIPPHSELAWILNTITPMGELRRMTQFKDKGGEQETANVGLFTYPVLMAADIILYDAKFVPVGDDQLQHLELARTLARKFNAKFPGRTGGNTFVEPQPLLTQAPRVMSLDDPSKKMSKSRPAGCIFLDDSPEEIHKKVMRATTDSESVIRYDTIAKPGISNLLRIYSSLSGELIPDLEKKFAGMNYSELKIGLANLISNYFSEFRKNKKAILRNKKLSASALSAGNKKALKIASEKIKKVKAKLGLL